MFGFFNKKDNGTNDNANPQQPPQPQQSQQQQPQQPFQQQEQPRQETPVPKNWQEYEPANPMVLLAVLFALTFIPMLALSYVQWFAAEFGAKTAETAEEVQEEAIYRTNPPLEVGTYPIAYLFDTTAGGKRSWHIGYTGEEGRSESFTLPEENVSFEAGGALEVTVYISTIDRMSSEGEDAEVLEANAQPADLHMTVRYDANRREVSTYGFVSLEKNGNAAAKLTFSEAAGVTDTVEVSPSLITVIDDGAGYVEKISTYDEHAQWTTRWIVHSLPY